MKEVGIKPSRGRTGSALDNAMAESFVSTLKAELVSNLEFPTRQAAKTAIFEYLECRALMYQRARAIWELLMEVHDSHILPSGKSSEATCCVSFAAKTLYG